MRIEAKHTTNQDNKYTSKITEGQSYYNKTTASGDSSQQDEAHQIQPINRAVSLHS